MTGRITETETTTTHSTTTSGQNVGQIGSTRITKSGQNYTNTTQKREEEADLLKSSFEDENIKSIDSEEIIQQISDHLDETDNILMRTDKKAVAESLAELAEEPFDPRDIELDSSVDGSVGELIDGSDAASVQSLISSDSRDREPIE